MDPKATVKVVWTNTWFAPATERTAAESLVAAGVSVLADGQDSPTTGQVAEAHGLKWTGYDSNQESFAPNAWLTATTYNWGPYYIQEVKAAMDGTWEAVSGTAAWRTTSSYGPVRQVGHRGARGRRSLPRSTP